MRLGKKLENVKVFIMSDYYIYVYMQENYTLTVLQNNPHLAERLKEQIEHIKKSSGNLTQAAQNYSNKYQEEVEAGTKKMQLLLENGKRRGFTEEEILAAQTSFCPTVRTPILNMLFFLVREHPDANNINFNRLAEDINKNPDILLEQHNKQYGSLQHDADIEKTAEKAPEMDEFIYGEMSHAEYQTIKKLKRLSQSNNENEAFLAYRKCIEMCKRYHLEFDKIKV